MKGSTTVIWLIIGALFFYFSHKWTEKDLRNKEKYVYTQSFNTRIVRFECNHGRAEIKLASNENITLTFYSTPETEAFWQKVDTGFILRKSANTNKVTTCKDSVCIDWEVVLPN